MTRAARAGLIAALLLGSAAASAAEPLQVVAFSRTAGFRHDSIDDALVALRALARDHRFALAATEDPAQLATALANADVVVFVNTTGDVLDASQQATLEDFVRGGGGWVGVHSAADTEYDWPFYGTLLGNGAWFASHPAIQPATLLREHVTHPASAHFASTTTFVDEWYNFRGNPRPATQVLLRLDEASYAPGAGAMGVDHPIAWTHAVDAGRAFYTGLGHRAETWEDAGFRRHLVAALHVAAGREFVALHVDGFE